MNKILRMGAASTLGMMIGLSLLSSSAFAQNVPSHDVNKAVPVGVATQAKREPNERLAYEGECLGKHGLNNGVQKRHIRCSCQSNWYHYHGRSYVKYHQVCR